MNFNKLGLVALSAGAIFMATSCQKDTVSLKQATKWVESHFTHNLMEETNFKQLKVTINASGTKGEDAIGNARLAAETYGIKNFDAKTLKGDATYTKDNLPVVSILSLYKYYYIADSFTGQYPDEEKVKESNTKFSIKDNKLTISSSRDAKDLEQGYDGGKMKNKETYDKEGAPLYLLNKLENGTNSTMYEGQVVNFSIAVTFEY